MEEVTAEVAIMNKLAVALAADSAVTTGPPGKEKIFHGANKVFTLSKHAPVGIMIYGHSEHCGVPWEVIIKEFRKELGGERLPMISDYVDRFIGYIRSPKIFSERQQEIGVLIACMATMGSLIAVMGSTPARRPTAEMMKRALDALEKRLYEGDFLQNLTDYTYGSFTRRYGALIDAFLEDEELTYIHIPKSRRSQFKRTVHLHLTAAQATTFHTGLVIAGFGEDELFPTMHQRIVDGGVAGRMRMMEHSTVDIARSKSTVHVEAFAQEDAVEAFMNGVDEGFTAYLSGMVQGFITDHSQELLDEHTNFSTEEKKVILAMINKNLPDSLDLFGDALKEHSTKSYRTPIEEVLRNAPKDELAHVAESLVNLTSLKRRVSGDRETVAGPVDVAVISKGDGFVWIKRKHYFDPKLNHHFMKNYFDKGGRA